MNAIEIREGDELVQVCMTDGKSEIVMATKEGKSIRFNEEKVRAVGRNAAGVRGVTIDESTGNEVIGMIAVNVEDKTETVSYTHLDVYKRQDLDVSLMRF